MKGTIELTGMQFRAYHGCLEQEKLQGNDFVVDFSCRYDFSAAASSDSLADTLDYGAVYEVVAEQMAQPSNLLEHVAARIARAIEAKFPGLEAFSVKVSKKNPPVAGPAEWSAVTIEYPYEQ